VIELPQIFFQAAELKNQKSYRYTEGADLLMAALLIPLYAAVWGRFGQKFAAAVGICLLTGLAAYFYSVISQPAEEKRDFHQVPFCWQLFALFPLFVPLAMPLWLIPFILLISYTVSISSFGGFGRHFFNPVAFAVLFMFCGYATTASLGPSRPMPASEPGYAVWTAGMPPAKPLWRIYSEVPIDKLFVASTSGNLPALPGSSFSGWILIIALLVILIGRKRLVWPVFSLLFTVVFCWLAFKYGWLSFSPAHPLLLGIMPSLLLISVVDYSSLPETKSEQAVSAVIFSVLYLVFIVKAENVLAPVSALLLARIFAPLICDFLKTGDAG